MAESCNRAVRLIAMLQILERRHQGATARELAQALGVSVRTMQRDLADVQDEPLRAPLYRDGWRWKLLKGR